MTIRNRYSKILNILILLINLSFSGCGTGADSLNWPQVLENIQKEFPDVRQLSTKELADWLKDPDRKPPIIFDTREQQEYAVSHIRSARNPNPKSKLENTVIGVDRKAPIVVYCSVGYRSSIFARKLKKLGFTNVYNLEGSIFKWANENRVVVREGKPVTKVHPYNGHWGKLLEKRYHPVPY